MRTATTVLNIIRGRGQRGLLLTNLYRLLYNRNLYLRATPNSTQQGALTPGTNDDTADAMFLAKIDHITISLLSFARNTIAGSRRGASTPQSATASAEGLACLPSRTSSFGTGNG
jgi:hypothetical protein